jgi:hypothetical protein
MVSIEWDNCGMADRSNFSAAMRITGSAVLLHRIDVLRVTVN